MNGTRFCKIAFNFNQYNKLFFLNTVDFMPLRSPAYMKTLTLHLLSSKISLPLITY